MIRRTLAIVLVSAVLASASILVGVSPAAACSCAGVDDATAFAHADAVFLAEVERIHEARTSDSATVAILRVSDVFKGSVDHRQGVATPPSGGGCGFPFDPGVAYLVFASNGNLLDLEHGFYEVNLCGGSRSLDDAAPASDLGFDATPSAPTDGGPPSDVAIRAQLGDPRSSLFPEALVFGGVLTFILGLAAWFSRKNRPAI